MTSSFLIYAYNIPWCLMITSRMYCYWTTNLFLYLGRSLNGSFLRACVRSTLSCLSIGISKTINFPFVPNGKLPFLSVPILKHIGVDALTLLHSGRPKLYTILAFLSAIGYKILAFPSETGLRYMVRLHVFAIISKEDNFHHSLFSFLDNDSSKGDQGAINQPS